MRCARPGGNLFQKENNPINAFSLSMARGCVESLFFHTIPPLDWATIFPPKLVYLSKW